MFWIKYILLCFSLVYTNNIWHSRDNHKVIHAHCRYIIDMVLLKKLLQVSIEQIHKLDQLQQYSVSEESFTYPRITSVGVQSRTMSSNPRISPKNIVTHSNSSKVC